MNVVNKIKASRAAIFYKTTWLGRPSLLPRYAKYELK
jgi:hypothetical protein